jgi:hypothetical protein
MILLYHLKLNKVENSSFLGAESESNQDFQDILITHLLLVQESLI